MSLDISLVEMQPAEVHSENITHNMTRMASEAGLYDCLWHPGDHGFKQAKQLIDTLTKGIVLMRANPDHFKQFNPANGWGDYAVFLDQLEALLEACIAHPEATIEAWT
jgi:hypothetical protein